MTMNGKESPTLECQITLEYLDSGKSFVSRRLKYKSGRLRLIRNEFREMFLEIRGDSDKRIIRQQLQSLNVHKKFMAEGKASIKFEKDKLNVLISNAPPTDLFTFLKLMTIKLVGGDTTAKSTRAKLLSSKAPSVDDISPLTEKDVQQAKTKLKIPDTTPTGAIKTFKRSLEDKTEIKAKKNCLMQIAEQVLSEEQNEILQAAKSGYSLFFTGSAGTGKSHLLKSIIAALPPDVTFATASTGVAACHIGGTTLHQFAGIGKGDGTLEHCISLASRPNIRNIWKKCQHLIIDEISMVHGDFFDKLEHIARIIRKNDRPFGGIQLILCGDFFQLPPVSNSVKFCFQSKVWEKCISRSFELRQIHRQSDPVLINVLQNIRIGRVTDEMTNILTKTSTQVIERNGILATRLCTHTADAIAINTTKLEELTGEPKIFKAIDTPQGMTDMLDKQSPVSSVVTLKIGAQVMLMKNINLSKGLVNGARGVVIKFDKDDLPVVKFSNLIHKVQREKFISKTASGIILSRVQIPLNLAWAFSIHKSQGLTLDCVEMSLGRVFEAGHAYVALSRVKSMESLRIIDFNSKQVWANNDVLVYYQKFRRKMQALKLIPLGNKNNKTLKSF